jgi:hypothetical protein
MATQAAVLAGFTTTCLIELNIPADTHPLAKGLLHVSAIFSICSNITCVSLSTITNIWGSGKALRGKDGSMDEAVEGINDERQLIFKAFACGLAGNLFTILNTCFIIMDFPGSIVASGVVVYTAWMIYCNATRIQKKFYLAEAVRLDDLTKYSTASQSHSLMSESDSDRRNSYDNTSSSSSTLLGNNSTSRSRKSMLELA